MKLKPHQKKALRAIFSGIKQKQTEQLVVVPTGGGKTFIACNVIKRLGGRALFLVHTDELVRQTVETLQKILPASAIGIVKGKVDDSDKRVVVASVQSLRNSKRLKRLGTDFRTIVWDECHRAQAASYRRIRQHFAKAKPCQLGLTATPWRLDGQQVSELFPHNNVNLTIKDGVREGWLSGVVGKLIYLKDADFGKLRIDHGDFKPSELEVVMRAANWDEHAAKAYFEHAGKRKTIIFVPTVAMAHQLAKRIQDEGGLAEAVDGQMGLEKRRDIVARLAAGKLNVVVNCAVLTEGFDDPLISCVIMARPTASWRLYVQCVGRGLRPVEGKTCLVLDMVGATRRHSLVNFPLFAKREGLPNGGRPEEGRDKPSSEVGPLNAEQEAMWVDLLGEKETKPPCPKCASGKTWRTQQTTIGNQGYSCRDCRCRFTYSMDGQLSPISLAHLRLNPPCTRCGSMETKKGLISRTGDRRYICKGCNRSFTLNSDGQPTKQAASRDQPKPPCVFCGSVKVGKSRAHESGCRAYRCNNCMRSFTLGLDGQPTQRFLSRSQPNPPCVDCEGGNVTKTRLRGDGTRSYRCKDCKRHFTVRTQPELSKPAAMNSRERCAAV